MNSTDFVVCIPARFGSSRLPGKPLIKLKGKELILWAIESANRLNAKEVVVATDDQRIFDFVNDSGHHVVMTSDQHQSGTDRIAECAEIMGWDDQTWVLNYQGDEPDIPVANVNQVLSLVTQHPEASIGTLYQSIDNLDHLFDPNIVKLVTDNQQRALYFSRAPIPWSQKNFSDTKVMPANVEYKHHIGLYVYKVEFLKRFAQMQPSMLETTESLEQLRALQEGEIIVVAPAVESMPHGIDTKSDIDKFESEA